MKLSIFFILVLIFNLTLSDLDSVSDNDFAEFEDVEDTESSNSIEENENLQPSPSPASIPQDQHNKISDKNEDHYDDVVVETEVDSEFEHFQDADEFEGYYDKSEKPMEEPKITIANVPNYSFRQNWDSYYLELLMILGLLIYFANFTMGRNKNTRIAFTWFQSHKQMLEDNFALVGDDGSLEKLDGSVGLVKESEHVFNLWCSGRTCCEGMLVELVLIKRQDLVSVIAEIMKPTVDHVHITVKMNNTDMDNFIFALANKKYATRISKELADISTYCPERKAGERYNIPACFQIMSEISEATSAMLDSKILAVVNKYSECIDYIHFSDQFSGLKPLDESSPPSKLPEVQKVLRFGFNIPIKGKEPEEVFTRLKPLMSMVFYYIDKVKRYHLSKEGKQKSDKNRQKAEEAIQKSNHLARTEAAAAKREEKRRLEKERIMAEDDPEKQRRWELKEEKRQAKKRAPRMKQLKVKAL